VLGESPAFTVPPAAIEAIASDDVRVLFAGDAGTGEDAPFLDDVDALLSNGPVALLRTPSQRSWNAEDDHHSLTNR